MTEPFPFIRRNRPATSTATYGRKAMAARRRLVSGSPHPTAITKPAAAFSDNNNNISSSSLDSDSSSNDNDDDNNSTNQLRERRTVRSAMSKLESLYNSTKSSQLPSFSSSLPKDVFDANKDKWDLGDDIEGVPIKIKEKSKPAKKIQKKMVRNKTDVNKPKPLPTSKVIKHSSKIPTPPAKKKTKTSTSSSSQDVVDSDSKVWDMSHLLESSPILNDGSICISDQKDSSDRANITIDVTPRPTRTQRQIYRDPEGIKTPVNVNRTVRNQGPSVDSAKRLQSRAYAHNVVFTYGRNRDDSDGLGLELGKAIGHPKPLFLPDYQPNVNHTIEDSSQPAASSSFAQQLGSIIQGLNSTTTESCRQLLDRLERTEFRGELFGSKYWLSMLLQGLSRARQESMVPPTTILVISLAFCIPTLMQTLVLERQLLETVAEILTLALTESTDMLSLRRKKDFDDLVQYRCVSTICRIAHKCGLLGSQEATLPLSTYNLVLCTLQRFMCTDDAAYLAMAPWLRSEMRESGCLGLIVERAITWSIPTFVGLYSTSDISSHHDREKWIHIFASKIHVDMPRQTQIADYDEDITDIWMDFDLPEEEKETPKVVLAATSKGSKNDLGRGGSIVHEPNSDCPTYTSIALELELLRFCSSGSVDSQDEILSVSSCVSSLISLLTTCYLASAILDGFSEPLINALEAATLILQLLVNLSNSSTVFCAKFRECDGLSISAKSVVIAAQQMMNSSSSQPRTVANHYSPKRKALLSADDSKKDIGDLRYDILLTTSALLANVVDSDPSSALFFDHIQQSPRCTLTQQCFPNCSCIGCLPLTNLLVQAFLACQKATPTDNCDAAIAAGYLAVLLGVLIRQRRSSCQDKILALLPKRDGKLLLIQHIQQLTTLSEAVTRRFGDLFGGLSSSLNSSEAIGNNNKQQHPLLLEGTSDSTIQALQPRQHQQQQRQSKVVSALKSLVASLEGVC